MSNRGGPNPDWSRLLLAGALGALTSLAVVRMTQAGNETDQRVDGAEPAQQGNCLEQAAPGALLAAAEEIDPEGTPHESENASRILLRSVSEENASLIRTLCLRLDDAPLAPNIPLFPSGAGWIDRDTYGCDGWLHSTPGLYVEVWVLGRSRHQTGESTARIPVQFVLRGSAPELAAGVSHILGRIGALNLRDRDSNARVITAQTASPREDLEFDLPLHGRDRQEGGSVQYVRVPSDDTRLDAIVIVNELTAELANTTF